MDLSITFQGLAACEAVEEAVRDCAAMLARVSDRVTGCHVTVSARAPAEGYTVEVELRVGDETIASSSGSSPGETSGWIYRTLGEAFGLARRQLQGTAAARP